MRARLILTCGLPGSGKTTLALRLAAQRSAVRLTKDEWAWALGTTPWPPATAGGGEVRRSSSHRSRREGTTPGRGQLGRGGACSA